MHHVLTDHPIPHLVALLHDTLDALAESGCPTVPADGGMVGH